MKIRMGIIMINEEILKKAIEKAVEGGWKEGETYLSIVNGIKSVTVEDVDSRDAEIMQKIIHQHELNRWIPLIIFSHDFAKAFFDRVPYIRGGNRFHRVEVKYDPRMVDTREGLHFLDKDAIEDEEDLLYPWQYHLQQMVLEKDPIKYLEKFL